MATLLKQFIFEPLQTGHAHWHCKCLTVTQICRVEIQVEIRFFFCGNQQYAKNAVDSAQLESLKSEYSFDTLDKGGGRYDQNLISRYDKFYYHDNNIYHDSDFFSFKKVFILLKSLISYNFHNPCHQCQYQTNTSLKRERKNNSTSLKINKQSVMK